MRAERIGALIGLTIKLSVGGFLLWSGYQHAQIGDIAKTVFFTCVGVGWMNAPVVKI